MKTVMFDMDGVLADFVHSAINIHNIPFSKSQIINWQVYKSVGMTEQNFFAPLTNYEFWANLPKCEDGFELFNKLHSLHNPHKMAFLTSPYGHRSADGKKDWLTKHLSIEWSDRAIFCFKKELCASPNKLLIDDHDVNVDNFIEHGGCSVLIPRPWNRRRTECDEHGNFHVESIFEEIVYNLS